MSDHLRLFAPITFLVLAAASLSAGGAAAQGGACAATTPEENISIVRAFFEARNQADMEAIDAILHVGFFDRGNQAVANDRTTNADELVRHQTAHDLQPGHEIRIDNARAFDDEVWVEATVIVSQHTYTGALVTIDTPFEIVGVGRYTIECGQIASATTAADVLGFLSAIGFQLVPPVVTPAP